jgi:hypothetical protein
MSNFAKVLAGQILEWRSDPVLTDQSALASTKPRWLPVVVEDVTFDPVSQVREGPTNIVEAARVVQRYAVRPRDVAAMRDEKLVAIRAEAQARIAAVVTGSRDTPLDKLLVKEINALARASSLNAKGSNSWTSGEAAEAQQLQALWAAVAAIRAKSNVKEAAVQALTDPALIAVHDPLAGWE